MLCMNDGFKDKGLNDKGVEDANCDNGSRSRVKNRVKNKLNFLVMDP